MNVNQVAFCTTTVLAAATVASVYAAAATATAVATVAFSVLAITLAAVSVAAIAAWVQKAESGDVSEYFNSTYGHSGHTIAGAYQFVAQALVQRLIFEGLGGGLSRAISAKLTPSPVANRF